MPKFWLFVGWIVALVYAMACALRLARFNVMIDDPNRPAWAANYFVGMPAPAGPWQAAQAANLGLPRLARTESWGLPDRLST